MRSNRHVTKQPIERQTLGSASAINDTIVEVDETDADDAAPIRWVSEYRYTGSELSALLDQVRRELGAEANIVKADRVRTGGVAGFFARETFEVVAAGPPSHGAGDQIARHDQIVDHRADQGGDHRDRVQAGARHDVAPSTSTALASQPRATTEISSALLARAEAISAQERRQLGSRNTSSPASSPDVLALPPATERPPSDDEVHDLRDTTAETKPFSHVLDVELRRAIVPPPERRLGAKDPAPSERHLQNHGTTIEDPATPVGRSLDQPAIIATPTSPPRPIRPRPTRSPIELPSPTIASAPLVSTAPVAATAPAVAAAEIAPIIRRTTDRHSLLDRSIVTVIGPLPAARALAKKLAEAEQRELVVVTDQPEAIDTAVATGRRYEDVSHQLFQWKVRNRRGVVLLDAALRSNLCIELRCLQSLGSELVRIALDPATGDAAHDLEAIIGWLESVTCPAVADDLSGADNTDTANMGVADSGTATTGPAGCTALVEQLLDHGVPVVSHRGPKPLIRYPAPATSGRTDG